MLCLEDEMNNEIDFRMPWKNTQLAKIRATVNGLALSIKSIRKQLKKTKSENRIKYLMHLQDILSYECRHQALALAFARKKNYLDLEKTCKEKPNYLKIFSILENYDFVLFDLKNISTKSAEDRTIQIKNMIFSWLKGENSNA